MIFFAVLTFIFLAFFGLWVMSLNNGAVSQKEYEKKLSALKKSAYLEMEKSLINDRFMVNLIDHKKDKTAEDLDLVSRWEAEKEVDKMEILSPPIDTFSTAEEYQSYIKMQKNLKIMDLLIKKDFEKSNNKK